jgi:hypothetical protein
MLNRLFFPFDSCTVASVFTGELLRRPGERAHCVLLDPSSRTELARAINGEGGLGIVDLALDPLEASLHSDPELGTSARASIEEPTSLRRSDGTMRPGVSVTLAGLEDGRKRMERPNA